jgi:predicted transcriptional regulator of viral defense system
MDNLLKNTLREYPFNTITDVDLELLMDGTPHSRYSKVKRLIKQGKLLHIRRGLYCLTESLGHPEKPHQFELAQRIYAPSYISFESALSYHQLIPERVYTVTSACTKRSKEFNTPVGIFSYLHLPAENFYIEVELISDENYRFFMAKPWKAICDYVYCNKQEWRELSALLESLRIDKTSLPIIKYDEIQLLRDYYQSKKMTKFFKSIQREFNL